MKKINKLFKAIYSSNKTLSTALLAGVVTLSVLSCADNDLLNNDNNGNNEVPVSFTVNDVQTRAIANSGQTITRGAINPHLSSADLATQKLSVRGTNADQLCIIETTIEGVNPVKASAATRANVVKTITENFSTSGHRGTTEAGITTKPTWFYKEVTQSNGKLTRYIPWAWEQPYGRFYAVSPQITDGYSKIKLSEETYEGTPYIDFENELDAKNQKDLMTACTGNVHYATRGTAPNTQLDFRHALTAIKFAVGQNLSINKTIDKIEIRNALSKGRYTLSNNLNGSDATWIESSLKDRQVFKLDNIAVSTNENPNTVIIGKDGDNCTFYMIPQTLTGNHVVLYVQFTDGTKIESELKGSWLAGTTKTYKLSEKNSTWNFVLESTSPENVAYNESQSKDYTITSYKIDPNGTTKRAVKWKAIGFEEFNHETGTWVDLGMNKPSWLTKMSKESGEGGDAAEKGVASLTKADLKDLLNEYNKVLQTATPKGTASKYYNLSNTTGDDAIQNTANSYLISAPGYYRIPLVYGNAITNSADNPSSYKTANTGQYILSTFKDHLGHDINSPYINLQNAATPATQASIVWMDQDGLVENLSVTNSGANSFVNFHVPADKIKNGNAVIAVKDASGKVMWSWHLWFDQTKALQTIECTNYQKDKFTLTRHILGYVLFKWKATSYEVARVARMKVEQEAGNNGEKNITYVTIAQNPYAEREYSTTLYQFGRKDAFPGTDNLYGGNIVEKGGNDMSIANAIQNPEKIYNTGNSWDNNYSYLNLWSMNTTTQKETTNTIVKTIYDPNPVGYHMPPKNTFSGITTTGKSVYNNRAQINALGPWDDGWHFYTKDATSPSTIYYPAIGSRNHSEGKLYGVKSRGYYWTGIPASTGAGCSLDITDRGVSPFTEFTRSLAGSIRPVSD